MGHTGGPNASPQPIDSDNDGLTDVEETILGTHPLLTDTDGDGFGDGVEVTAGTDPLDNASHPPADGDVTGDGNLNVADLLIMQRIVLGIITPSTIALAHGDLYPPSSPDSILNISDLILLSQMILMPSIP